MVLDNLHYYDSASIDIARYRAARMFPRVDGSAPRSVNALRWGQNVKVERSVMEVVEEGAAVLIDVGPLAPNDVSDMIDGVNAHMSADARAFVAASTHGNPQYIF